MGTTSQKLTYLSETKSQLKDMINYGLDTGEKITSETTFRNYVKSLFDAFIKTMTYPDVLYNNLPKVTGEGTSVTLNDTVYAPMKVELSPSELEQGANPTPDNPQQIHTVSGENSVKIQNKNLFNGYTKGIGLSATTGAETTDSNSVTSDFIPLDITGTNRFKVWGLPTTISSYVAAYNKDKQFVGRTGGTITGIFDLSPTAFQAGSPTAIGDVAYVRVTSYKISTSPGTINDIDNAKVMLERGTTATSYVEHKSQSLPLSLGDLEYCKIGDYEDEFYKATESDTGLTAGKWYLKKNIRKVVLDGTEEDWFNDGGGAPFAIHAPVKTIDSQCMVMSDYFIGLKYNASWTVYDAMVSTSKQTATNPALKFRYADIGGLANFKTWLGTHNTTVYYVLLTPTYTLLSDTLQTQLDNIQKAITYQDQTNVSQTNNDLPFVIKMSAIRDLSGIFEEI